MAKTQLKLKKVKRARKLVKDKAIVNFLLEHMKPVKINFSKIKIPSFLTFLENEGNNAINSNLFQSKIIPNEIPVSGICLLNSLLETGHN